MSTRLNINQVKTYLSKYVSLLEKGGTIILCKRNNPIAEIRGIKVRSSRHRPQIGFANGRFKVTEPFFDELPEDVLDAFEGK